MSYLTNMDKHAPYLRQMQKLRVRTIVKSPRMGMEYTYDGPHGNIGRRLLLTHAGGKWLLALQYVDDAAVADYFPYNRMSVFYLNHDRIRGALVQYEEAAAALEVG